LAPLADTKDTLAKGSVDVAKATAVVTEVFDSHTASGNVSQCHIDRPPHTNMLLKQLTVDGQTVVNIPDIVMLAKEGVKKVMGPGMPDEFRSDEECHRNSSSPRTRPTLDAEHTRTPLRPVCIKSNSCPWDEAASVLRRDSPVQTILQSRSCIPDSPKSWRAAMPKRRDSVHTEDSVPFGVEGPTLHISTSGLSGVVALEAVLREQHDHFSSEDDRAEFVRRWE
jgi:hypothetical protein